MRIIPAKSLVEIVECINPKHKGFTGHIISKRTTRGYNVRLFNHVICPARKVKLITRAYEPKDHQENFFWNLAMSLWMNRPMF